MSGSSRLIAEEDDSQGPNPWSPPGADDAPSAPDSDRKTPVAKVLQLASSPKGRAALALADQLVVSGSNFLTMALVANYCTQSEVGVFHLAWILVNFIRTANERTLAAPYMAFVHRDDQDSKTLLGSSLVHQALFAVACCVFLIAFGGISFTLPKLRALGPIVLLLVLSLPWMLLRDHVRAICSAHFQYHVSLAVDCVASLLQVGGILGLAVAGYLTIPRVVMVLGGACLVPAVAWLAVSPREYQIERSAVASHWKQNWGYARWLVLSRSIAIGGNNLIPFLVVFMMDQASAGAFGICTSLVGLSLTFIMGANNFFLPRTVKAYHEVGVDRMMQMIYQAIGVFASALACIVALFLFAGGWLLGRIYGPDYASNGPIISLLSLGYLVISVSIACSNGLAALGKSKEYLVGEVAYCIVAVTLSAALIPAFGLVGAATALLVASCVSSAITMGILWNLVRKQRAESTIHRSERASEDGSLV